MYFKMEQVTFNASSKFASMTNHRQHFWSTAASWGSFAGQRLFVNSHYAGPDQRSNNTVCNIFCRHHLRARVVSSRVGRCCHKKCVAWLHQRSLLPFIAMLNRSRWMKLDQAKFYWCSSVKNDVLLSQVRSACLSDPFKCNSMFLFKYKSEIHNEWYSVSHSSYCSTKPRKQRRRWSKLV